MNLSTYLSLFNLKKYEPDLANKCLIISYIDTIYKTNTSINHIFKNSQIELIINETLENKDYETHIIIELNDENIIKHIFTIKNEILSFLDIELDSEKSIEFVSNYSNNYLIPTYELKLHKQTIDM